MSGVPPPPPPQQSSSSFSEAGGGRVSTADTIAAARARQAQKDEFAHTMMTGGSAERDDELGATLYEPHRSLRGGASTGILSGGVGAGHASGAHSPSRGFFSAGEHGGAPDASSLRQRTRPAKPPKPDFMVTSKAPVSRKLQQIQKEAQLYNAQPRTKSMIRKKKKSSSSKKKKSGDTADETSDAAAAASGAPQPSARRRRLQDLDRSTTEEDEDEGDDDSERPLEHPADSPWLDAVAANMGTEGSAGGVQGQAGGRNLGRVRGHRASIVYKEHEPIVGLATVGSGGNAAAGDDAPPAGSPDVDALATHMQKLFELQRTPAATAGGAAPARPTRGHPAAINPVTNTSTKYTYVFGQRVPVDAFPQTFSAAKKAALMAQQQRQHQQVQQQQAVGARTAAERAQLALAAALASIKPSAPKGASPSPDAAANSNDEASLVALALADESDTAGQLGAIGGDTDDGVVATAEEAEAAAAFARQFEMLSPDAYYQKLQNQLQLDLAGLANQSAFDFDKQLRAASDADNASIAERSEHGSTVSASARSNASRPAMSSPRQPLPPKQSHRARDPFGVYRNTPAGTGDMYLQQLAKRAAAQSQRWGEVNPTSAEWGASLGGGGGAAQPQRKRFLGKQAGQVIPPPRSQQDEKAAAERRRARQHAAYVRQLQVQQALALDQNFSAGAALEQAAHPALTSHLHLLDAHPEAAQFLAQGAFADAQQDFGLGPQGGPDESLYDDEDEEPYDDEEGEEQYYDEEADQHVQVGIAPIEQEYDQDQPDELAHPEDDMRYPLGMHSHTERMARSRALAASHAGPGLDPVHSYTKKSASRSTLKAELMGALHAGLFGQEDAAGPLPLPAAVPELASEQAAIDALHFQHSGQQQQQPAAAAAGGHARRLSASALQGHNAAMHAAAQGDRSTRDAGAGGRRFSATASSVPDDTASQSTLSEQPSHWGQHGRRMSTSSSIGGGGSLISLSNYSEAVVDPSFFTPGAALDPEASFGVVPPSLLAQVAAEHFVGRELHRQVSARPRKPLIQQTSKSATKRRTDERMERMRNPELAAQAAAERQAAQEAMMKEQRAARRKQKAAQEAKAARAAASSSTSQYSAESEDPAAEAARQRMRDAIAGRWNGDDDDSTLGFVHEGSESAEQSPLGTNRGAAQGRGGQASSLAALAAGSDGLSGDDGAGGSASEATDAEIARHVRAGAGTTTDEQRREAEEQAEQQKQQQRKKDAVVTFDRARNEAKVRAGIAKFAALGARKREERADPVFPVRKPAVAAAVATARSKEESKSNDSGASGAGGGDVEESAVSRLDMLYFKAKLTQQKLVAARAAQAAAELSECSFQPNLDVVFLKGKTLSKAAMARERERIVEGKKKRRRMRADGVSETDDDEAESSIHSSMAPSNASGAEKAQSTKQRLDALYAAHEATQARLRAQREAAARAAAEAEKAELTFTPNVHPHRPVAATVALAHTQFVKGFDEKVERMRRGTREAQAASFAASLRSTPGAYSAATSGAPSRDSMRFGLDPAPVHEAHKLYITANKSVVLPSQVPASAPGPGTALSSLPFAAVQPRENPAHTSVPGAGTFRQDAHTPVPQLIMPSAGGANGGFQMLSGANPGSPRSLHFGPSTNKASFLQDGQAMDQNAPLPDQSGIGMGSLEGADKLAAPKPSGASAAAAAAMALTNPADLGLGIVLPNNSPGSVLPRALALHEHVSSYSYHFVRQQVVEKKGAQAVATPAPPARTSPPPNQPPFSLSSRSGATTPSKARSALASPTAAAMASPVQTVQRSTTPTRLRIATSPSSLPSAGGADSPLKSAAAAPVTPSSRRTGSPSPSRHATGAAAVPVGKATLTPVSASGKSPSRASSASSASVLLFVDIALPTGTERIVVHKGDHSADLAAEFTKQHGLDPAYAPVIQSMLDQQIQALPPESAQ